jgi:Putative rhamnosyl transferase
MATTGLQHFIVTRLGIGIQNEDWFRSTLALFEAVTFPSLRAQSCEDFTSLLIVGHDMPASARSRLAEIIGGHPNFHVVPIDLLDMRRVRHGCFDYVWDCCQEYLLANRLIADPFGYIVTSVLDGDDALHRDTVALVRERAAAEMPEFLEAERKYFTWRRHTGGMCLTFPDGLQWFAHPDVVQPMHCPFHSMSVFVAARFSSGISACSSRHSAWPSYCEVLGFKVVAAEAGRPMWVYVRHDRNEVPWQAEHSGSDQGCAEILHGEFAIDFEKMEQWRRNRQLRTVPAADSVPLSHDGMWAKEQLDTYFRITAFNRQIAALEHEDEGGRLDAAGQALLEKQRALRETLRGIYREQALSMFR